MPRRAIRARWRLTLSDLRICIHFASRLFLWENISGPSSQRAQNLEKFQDRPPGLKFSSEIETNDIFKRD